MIMDSKEVQKFQDGFCESTHLYCSCINKQQETITNSGETREEQEFLSKYTNFRFAMDVMERFSRSAVEDVIEEELEVDFIRECVLAIRVDGELEAVWLIRGVIKELVPPELELPPGIRFTSQDKFYPTIKLLHTSFQQYLETCAQLQKMELEMEENDKARFQMEQNLRRSEVMTSVVQMLESEAEFSHIMEEILERVCNYLRISGGSLLRLDHDTDTMDMVCEFRTPETSKRGSEFRNVSRKEFPFANGKPYMLSGDSVMPKEFKEFFKEQKLKAGIFLPVEVNHQVIMYLCFSEQRQERLWNMDDIKFLNDVKKIVQSILTKRITKNSLAGSYVSLEAILENVRCGICVRDYGRNQILFTNQRFRDFFAKSLEDGSIEQRFRKPGERYDHRGSQEYYLEDEDKWFDIHETEIVWVDGREVALFTVYDITDTKRYQQRIERQANNDFLTGLYNRMRCEQDLSNYIRQTKESNGQGALLYIDLDDFKHINDGLGHRYGDVLLKAISHSLQRIPGIENTCYRMGGDEFIIIITQYHFAMISQILKDIQGIFEKPWFLKGADYYCTMSMGVVKFPTDGETVQELIQKADIALYEAKKRGKNRCEFYSENEEPSSVKRLDLEKNMRQAASESCSEFEVYYQPIFDISQPGNPCTGAEALLRWNSQSLGFISPGEFIPLAEYLGLINPIGNHVLTEACRQCKQWNEMGHPGYKVNVNLSVVQLLQTDIVEKIDQVLKETRISPDNLTLEVTESLAVNDMARMKMILGKIKALGVRVALDDFGTGYSSLNHIREMPIDVIKIDRCFIMDIGQDEFADVFVKVVAELAETIGMHICVEGVETEEQYETLKGMKIPLVQGFYFDRPMRAEEFVRKYV